MSSKFGQETLLRTAKFATEKAVNYVKQNADFGFETKIASQATAMKNKENNILGKEANIQSSVQGAHKTYSKIAETLGLEAAMLNQALNPNNKISDKITNSTDRIKTDAYYEDVKKHAEKYKQLILSTDNLYDKEIKQYYKDIQTDSELYSKTAEKSQEENNKLLKEYYDSIEDIVNQNLGGDWKNELKTIIKTQAYYVAVRGISLAFKLWSKAKDKKDTKLQQTYYKALNDFSTFGLSTLDQTKSEYKISLDKKDNFDTDNLKTQALKDEKWNQDGKVYKQNKDTLTGMSTIWEQDPDYVDLKGVEGKYIDLINYVNNIYIKYISGEIVIGPDNKENIPESLSKISQKAQERWDEYHSYDTISPEMRAAIIYSQNSNADPNDLEAVKELIIPKQNQNIPSHSRLITQNYLENKEFTTKKEVGIEQSTLKKGFTVINSSGKIEQKGVTSPEKPYSKTMAEILEKSKIDKTGAYKFFIEKLHGRKTDMSKGFNKRNLITPGKKYSDMDNRMVFPAYIEAFNDSYDVNSNSYEFSGRAEPFWIYKSTGRTLSLSFFMVSDFSAEMLLERFKRTGKANPMFAVGTSAKDIINTLNDFFIDWGNGSYELPKVIEQDGEYGLLGWIPGQYSGTTEQMWARMTFLAQCCYPWFRKDGKLKEQPLVRIRIGDFIDQVVKIKSLQFDEYEEFNMDLTGQTIVGAYPMGVKCVISADIIHSEEPHSEYEKFYWRQDFDKDDARASVTKPAPEKIYVDEDKVPKKVKEEAVLPADLTSRMNNLSNLAKGGEKSDIDNTNVRKDNGGVYRNEGKKVDLQGYKK